MAWILFAITLAISLSVSRLGEEPDGWWRGAARGLVFGALGWMAYRAWRFVAERPTVNQGAA